MNTLRSSLVLLIILLTSSFVSAAVYEVKPGTPLDTIAEVPWAALQPGDLVLIHWRSDPYKEKWVICRQGTAGQPIVIRGVPNLNGDLPVIDGRDAVTPQGLNFWSEQRGVIKIGGANVPADTMPRHIVIENLEIRSAHPDYSFTADDGSVQNYSSSASSIYVEKGEHITIRNTVMHDSANGFFVASSDNTVSREILVEGNYIYGNGISGSAFQHNNYTAGINITFQFNRFGPLRTGSVGNALKDRSAGTVVRYNWIEGGNRQLDLVDAEDSSQIRGHPDYGRTFVYGNILIEPDGAGNSQIAHYGGDSGATSTYRKGKLYFYNNTVISTRSGNTTLLRLSTNEESADVRNNILYVTASGNRLGLIDNSGTVDLTHNWSKAGLRVSHSGSPSGSVNDDGTGIVGTSPGFADESGQDFTIEESSSAVDAGTGLHPTSTPLHNVVDHYLRHRSSEPRPSDGTLDLGAYEFSNGAPVAIETIEIPIAKWGRHFRHTLAASGGSGAYTWSIVEGALPSGLWLDGQTGSLHGKAIRRGDWTFTVRAEDPSDPFSFDEKQLSISIHLYPGSGF